MVTVCQINTLPCIEKQTIQQCQYVEFLVIGSCGAQSNKKAPPISGNFIKFKQCFYVNSVYSTFCTIY